MFVQKFRDQIDRRGDTNSKKLKLLGTELPINLIVENYRLSSVLKNKYGNIRKRSKLIFIPEKSFLKKQMDILAIIVQKRKRHTDFISVCVVELIIMDYVGLRNEYIQFR